MRAPRLHGHPQAADRSLTAPPATPCPLLLSPDADESRPAEAFTTERAVRNGRANAASGRIMVNVPNDHFGPILPEHDPVNGKVRVCLLTCRVKAMEAANNRGDRRVWGVRPACVWVWVCVLGGGVPLLLLLPMPAVHATCHMPVPL